MSDAIDEKPRMVEFCCDRCLYCIKGNDLQPIPRCPRCKTRMTPDDLNIPRDLYSSQRPQMARRKVDGVRLSHVSVLKVAARAV